MHISKAMHRVSVQSSKHMTWSFQSLNMMQYVVNYMHALLEVSSCAYIDRLII